MRTTRSTGDPLLFWIGVLNRRTGWSGSKLHIWLYRRLRGRLVGSLRGRPIVLLTTTGRRTGQLRTAPITVLRDGDDYLAIASYAPQWARNLGADPTAVIEDRGATQRVTARISADIHDRERFREFYPALGGIEEIARKEQRPVPLFRFSPSRSALSPPTPTRP
ncbi:MAG: nitroreductase family deazaflavin-dependent oxidoreductase [Acidimicrobiia bacterium]|nr:nitroreductase family deazaflavin-dependent oxidoreductase [Acidimicrobiia bacterium]